MCAQGVAHLGVSINFVEIDAVYLSLSLSCTPTESSRVNKRRNTRVETCIEEKVSSWIEEEMIHSNLCSTKFSRIVSTGPH